LRDQSAPEATKKYFSRLALAVPEKGELNLFLLDPVVHISFARRIGRSDGQNYARDSAPGFPVGRRLSGIVPKASSNFRDSAEIREMPKVGGGRPNRSG